MGTSSLHRKILFQKYFELETMSIRGNVGTRLSKVQNNDYSCTFLAKAGLDRLGLFSIDDPSMFVLNPKPVSYTHLARKFQFFRRHFITIKT